MRQLVAVFLVLLVLGMPTAGSADLASRSQAIGQEQALRRQERDAALTLLSLDEQLAAGRAKAARIQAGLPAAGQAVSAAVTRLNTARTRLALDQKRLGEWLNFLYRYGDVSLVAQVLEAKSWSDLESRLVFVTDLMENQADLWQRAKVREADLTRAVAGLRNKQDAMQREEADLAATVAALGKERETRQAYLASLERQSAVLAREVAGEDALWVADLQPLTSVLSDLGNLPWDGMTPDNVSFGFDQVTLEFSDSTLTGVLDSGGATLQLAATSSGVVISGSANGVPFKLKASLAVAGPRTVQLVPKELDLAGLPVQPNTMTAVTGDNPVFNLPAEDPQWKLSSINTGPGYVDFLFGQ